MAKKKPAKPIDPAVATARKLVDAWIAGDVDNNLAMESIVGLVEWNGVDAKTTKRVLEILLSVTPNRDAMVAKLESELEYARQEDAEKQFFDLVYDSTRGAANHERTANDIMGLARATFAPKAVQP